MFSKKGKSELGREESAWTRCGWGNSCVVLALEEQGFAVSFMKIPTMEIEEDKSSPAWVLGASGVDKNSSSEQGEWGLGEGQTWGSA